MASFDIIVIGGGLVGGAIAWGAARQGARVALIDEGDVAFRAARGNFGLVWIQGKGADMPAYAQWSRRSGELWPQLHEAMAEAVGIDIALQQTGGYIFCLTDDEYERRAALIARMHNQSGDIGTVMLGRSELRARLPMIGDGVVGAAFCPRDGHANPLKLLRSLQAALQASGGAYLPGITVERIDAAPRRFTVWRGGEAIVGDKLVIAAGLGSAKLAPMVGLSMPVRPLRGQIVVTERLRRFLPCATHIARQTDEGSVMLGDSHEDAGFDVSTSVEVMRAIVARNLAVFPLLRDANIVRVWAALRVMTPDGCPIYQQSERFPGAFAATCHSGVTLAAAHALALAPAILAGHLPESFDAFDPRRFELQPVR